MTDLREEGSHSPAALLLLSHPPPVHRPLLTPSLPPPMAVPAAPRSLPRSPGSQPVLQTAARGVFVNKQGHCPNPTLPRVQLTHKDHVASSALTRTTRPDLIVPMSSVASPDVSSSSCHTSKLPCTARHTGHTKPLLCHLSLCPECLETHRARSLTPSISKTHLPGDASATPSDRAASTCHQHDSPPPVSFLLHCHHHLAHLSSQRTVSPGQQGPCLCRLFPCL